MFTLDQSKVESLLLDALKSEMRSALSSQYGTGQKLRSMVDAAIAANQPEIESQVRKAVLAAIQSPDFMAMAQAAMLDAMKGKFAGAFEGVMRAAGKRAAQDHIAVNGIASALIDGRDARAGDA